MMQGIPIVRVPLFVRRESKSWQLAINYISFALFGCLLAPLIFRNKSFDVIFAVNYSPITAVFPALLIRKIKKIPMFLWVQDLWPESLSATGAIKSPAILSAVGQMVKHIYHGCDSILVQSRGFVEPVVAVGAQREKIRYFPNWAESLYQPVSLKATAVECGEIPDQGFVLMFAGNLGVAQSLDTIIAAAETLKDEMIHWVFLGDGRRRSWLQDEVEAKGLQDKVHILGSRPMEAMPAYFSLASAMLVTLRDDPVMATTIPGKLQSYLACARPVIGALNGEGAKVIDESGAGYSVASDDSQGLASAVLKMSRLNDAERDEMGQAARRYYQGNFDRNMLVHQLEIWMEASSGADK
jgi:glycosyltransferase involved in cell wall biosynthesis